MSKKEKQGIVILLVCLILWLTQSVHKIDAGMVALLGSAAMAFCGLITTPDLCAKGQWNLIIFIGALLGFSSFMSSTGASTWIAGLLGPIISPIISSPYIFVPCLCIITFLLRHVIVSQLCCLAIMLAIFGPLLPDAGISMFVLVLVEYMSGMIWNTAYMNPVNVAAIKMAGGKYVTFEDSRKTNFLYMACCLIGFTLSVPVWQALGLC